VEACSTAAVSVQPAAQPVTQETVQTIADSLDKALAAGSRSDVITAIRQLSAALESASQQAQQGGTGRRRLAAIQDRVQAAAAAAAAADAGFAQARAAMEALEASVNSTNPADSSVQEALDIANAGGFGWGLAAGACG